MITLCLQNLCFQVLKVFFDFAYTRDIYIVTDALVRKVLASSCVESILYQGSNAPEFHIQNWCSISSSKLRIEQLNFVLQMQNA